MLFYVPAIILVARSSGVRPSGVAAVLSFLALDLVFVPPYYHLNVADVPEWIGLVVFLIVALIAGQQTGRLRERERVALRRQQELELLNSLSYRIAGEKSVETTAEFIVAKVTELLSAERAALYIGRPESETPVCVAEAGAPHPASGEAALVSWVLREGIGIAARGERLRARTRAGRAGWPLGCHCRLDGRRHIPSSADVREPRGGALCSRGYGARPDVERARTPRVGGEPGRRRVRAPALGAGGGSRRGARRDGPDEVHPRVLAVTRAQDAAGGCHDASDGTTRQRRSRRSRIAFATSSRPSRATCRDSMPRLPTCSISRASSRTRGGPISSRKRSATCSAQCALACPPSSARG